MGPNKSRMPHCEKNSIASGLLRIVSITTRRVLQPPAA